METEVKLPAPWKRGDNLRGWEVYYRGAHTLGNWSIEPSSREKGKWRPDPPFRIPKGRWEPYHIPEFDDPLAAILWVEVEVSNSSA